MSSAGTMTIPGTRIDHRRNSSPRLIRLLGLGERGGNIARNVAKRELPNVQVLIGAQPVGWKHIVAEDSHPRTNMIVIVCGEGDEPLFRPEHGKPDMLVTFVVLQSDGEPYAAGESRVANVRGFSDLFVTTSDVDYVSELIDNLAG